MLLALGALAASEVAVNKTKKEPTENFSYLYEDYDEEVSEITYSEDKPCPRNCICTVSQGYRIANCNRLEVGTQKFGDDVTDLVLENIDSKHPIVLDDMIFKKLGLHQISSVKIVNSTIKSISPSAFHGLHELYAVNLSGNKIKKIHPETFTGNKKLLLLTLANNPLQFPVKGSTDYFLKSTSIQELDVSKCDLKYVPGQSFSEMPALMYISLAGNHLSDLESDLFKKAVDLEELDLSDNELTTLPNDLLSVNDELATLHIHGTQINSVYGLLVSNLLTLNAGEANIKFVGPSMFNGMAYVANLNLSGNGIEKIHNQAFHKLVELNYLDLSNNNLDFISSILIKENVELDIFKIANNPKLKALPAEGFACAAEQFNIYIFDASRCGLESLGDNAFSTFPALTQLDLSTNNLKTLSENVFAKITRLFDVNLSNNGLTVLENNLFAQNKDLSKINLHGNPLKVLSAEVFVNTPSLTWMDVSACQLNALWEVKSEHKVFNNLHFLNVSMNNITQVKESELKMIEKLHTLDISYNPLYCDKHFTTLLVWLNDNKVSPNSKDIIMSNMETDVKTVDEAYSWDFLARKTCESDYKQKFIEETSSAKAPIPSDEEIWEIKKADSDNIFKIQDADVIESDLDEFDDEDEDEDEDDDNEIELNVKLLDDMRALLSRKSHGPYTYLWIILGVVSFVIILFATIGMIVMRVCRKQTRRSRYNSAIIAAMSAGQGRTKKDCGLVYQQLSEELTGPKTPILSRYAPLPNPGAKANVSYLSSPFHHSNITPEAV